MTETNLGFDDIFKEVCPNEFNEFGLKREMRFISERIIVEYDPSDHLSVREIMHPMDAFRSHEPYFRHKLVDKSKEQFVTAIDFHEHITYFPYAKNTGDICLARYISNFNDINFTKISGQDLCSLPGETIHGVRVGRLDKGMLAANHRTGSSVNSTVTVIDLVRPARNIAHYDSLIPVNTIDWVWHSPFLLAVGDDQSLRIMDVRCPKAFNAVFFEGGVQRTALCSSRPLEISCWNGTNVLIYDVRRPDVPCAIYDIGLHNNEKIMDLKYNPYIIDELFVHTNRHRVYSLKVNPVNLVGGRAVGEKPYNKWQVITFKHIDRGCTATRHTVKRKQMMPFEDEEIPLHDYYNQYETAKNDPQVPLPTIWTHPSKVDKKIFKALNNVPEVDYESYLYKAVERVSADVDYKIIKPKVFYEAKGVETFDFVFPGVNGIMCFDREHFAYKIVRSPKHYEGSINPYTGSDAVHFYRGLQIQEMIPAQTMTMMCNRLEAGWNAYQVSERSLKCLAYKITEETTNLWSYWLRNSAIMQYGGEEFMKIGKDGLKWKEIVPLPDGPLPVPDIPPYDHAKDNIAAEEICQMIAPFFRLFMPDPRPDLLSDSESEPDEHTAPPPDPYEPIEHDTGLPAALSQDMRILCKCHAKMRYYNKNKVQRKYMYTSVGNTFFIGASKRIREKFFKLRWREITKPQILAHRLLMDTKVYRRRPIDDLSKFQRFKAREFQKRVLPPKLIMDTNSMLMKPEYIKERERKEKEMKEKAAQPITAPIGLSMPKLSKKEPVVVPTIPDVSDEDPERARFLIRAAIQLADNNSSDDETVAPPPQATPTPPPPPPPSAAAVPVRGPQATSTRNEKDDFEYETAEDAYFGIKKKRMYVLYQPATAPLGLRRYKPDRLGENTFIRRLEHLMYWGRRRHERDILYGRFEENDKRQSSVKERSTLDLKLALNNHMKVGWQTFYDKNFFFSNKVSYNQILRKAIQMYNRMYDDCTQDVLLKNVRHERMMFGVKPRYIVGDGSMEEILELRHNCTMIENPSIQTYNHFMNYLQSQMPYKIGNNIYLEEFEGDCPLELDPLIPLDVVKQTAVYDEDEKYMYPKGRIRFCETDIPPNYMREIERRRLPPPPPKKPKQVYLEDLELPSTSKVDYSGLRRTRSSPDLSLDLTSTKNMNFDDVNFANVIRRVMGNRFLEEYEKFKDTTGEEGNDLDYHEGFSDGASFQFWNRFHPENHSVSAFVELTKFINWDSPMIADTDRNTGRKFMRRVVPFKEPQPPRQIDVIDPFFEFITLEDLIASAKNIHVSYMYHDPILFTWPGLQVLDKERDQMFVACSKVPHLPSRPLPSLHKPPLDRPKEDADFYTHHFTENMLLGHHPSNNRVRAPVYEEHSINIPQGILDILKPAFYGYFDFHKDDRYDPDELFDMRNRRELQEAIFEKRFITFRQPVIEETEQELEIESKTNVVEEDDLKTTSEESEGEEEPVKSPIRSTWQSDQSGSSSEESLESGDEAYGFWKMFKEQPAAVNLYNSPVQRKHGMFFTGDDEPVCAWYNPHTRTNIRKTSLEEENIEDEPRVLGSVLSELYEENRVKQKRRGGCPFGSPKKSSMRSLKPQQCTIVGPVSEIAKPAKSVTWGENTEHSVPGRKIRPVRTRGRYEVEVDRDFLKDLYSVQMTRKTKSTGNFQKMRPGRKNSDPTAVSNRGLPRRSSLDQFYKKEAPAPCDACIAEPWPTKEACIVCHPDTSIYRCTNISKLNVRCHVCRSNIYKFSCMNYLFHSQYSNKLASLLKRDKLHPIDEKFKEKYAVKDEVAVKLEETPAVWTTQSYKSGTTAVDTLFSRADERHFTSQQSEILSGYLHREFHWVTWQMDEDKSEKVIVSEEFDVAFDRDADIDMMRDTMNTISQDGEMDMMTTYDQRTGMRIRRWISYAALATRVQKQTDKVQYRKRVAEREARILAGEISVKPALLKEIKRKAKDKEVAAIKANEIDEQKQAEERRRQYKLWKKLPIPAFPEDTRKDMPDFGLPKSEDWLESSGSEDELPPIRSRILSKELKEFIDTIRAHMERKPKNFDGLKVTYGKLFEKRPILKNDIVLVTKKKNMRRRPPPFRIQRIPLDENWLNSALTVTFIPQKPEAKYPKDSMKWTVPFYTSTLLNLTEKEMKDRTYRPPTPPLSIKNQYKKMKLMEKAYFHHKRVKVLASMRKAKVARQMRFHRKLYGRAKLPVDTPKAWTTAWRKSYLLKPKKAQIPSMPGVPEHKRYIFSYVKKRRPRRIRLSMREPSRVSSSSDELCPIVQLPKVRKVVSVQELPDENAAVQVDDLPTKGSSLPAGLIDRKKKQLKRDSTSEVYQLVNTVMRHPESGQLKKRIKPPTLKRHSSFELKDPKSSNLRYKKLRFDDEPEEPYTPKLKNLVFVTLDDASVDNFSEGTPAITLLGDISKNYKRESRKTEPKETINTDPIADLKVELAKEKIAKRLKRENKEKVEKPLPSRAKSAPLPYQKKSKEGKHTGRAFSVDSGNRCKKACKLMAVKKKKVDRKNKREAKLLAEQGEIAVEEQVPEAPNVNPAPSQDATKSDSALSSTTASSQRLSRHLKRLRDDSRKKLTKKRSIPVSKHLKKSLEESMSKAKVFESSRAKGTHTERPLQPRWLPSDHETDKKGYRSASHYHHQHMRFKRYTRKRRILHMEPVRSRVLNTIRRLSQRKRLNQKMKYQEPMQPKFTDIFLNPWKPLLSWPVLMDKKPLLKEKRMKLRKLSRAINAQSAAPQPMSWKQMLAKLADYKVSIKRIRMTNVKLAKEDLSESIEPMHKFLEVIVEPDHNLKSCMKKGEGRRSLMFVSQQQKEKSSFIGFNKTLRLVKPQSRPPPSAEKTKPIPSNVMESVLGENTLLKDTWLTNTRKSSKTKEDKEAAKKEQTLDKAVTPTSRYENLDFRPSPSPVSARATPSSPEPSQKDPTEDNSEIVSVTIPAPPPKAPADQQWRAAMMARRYMSLSKPVIAPMPKKTQDDAPSSDEKLGEKPDEKTGKSVKSEKKPEMKLEEKKTEEKPVKKPPKVEPPKTQPSVKENIGSSEAQRPTHVQPAQTKPTPVTAPSQLPRMAGTKARDNKVYEAPVAKPKATAPPPVIPVASKPKRTVYSWFSDSSGDEAVPNAPSTSGTASVSQPSFTTPAPSTPAPSKPVETQAATPSSGEKKHDNSGVKQDSKQSGSPQTPQTPQTPQSSQVSPNSQPTTSTPSRSFFQKLFGKKKEPPLVITTTEEVTEARTSPVLPHIKKPETGQLMKRSPTSDTPRHVPTGNETIVKFVDGKPIADLPPYNWAMSQRRRNKTGSGSASSSSSGSGSDNEDGPSRKNSRTKILPAPKLTSALKQTTSEANIDGEGPSTSQMRSTSSKSVRFGPTSYAPLKPPTPPPVIVTKPKPEPRPEISFESLAEEMLKEQKAQQEKEEAEKKQFAAAIAAVIAAAAADAAKAKNPGEEEAIEIGEPAEEKSFFSLLNISPFGKSTKKTPTSPVGSQPSTSGFSLAALHDPSMPSTSAGPSTSEEPFKQKLSTRHQFKMSDPSALPLTGNPNLPRPAQPEPEKPPQLEVPSGVQRYDPVSQRKYYNTRQGQEWKPPRKRIPLRIPKLKPLPPREPEPEPEPLPAALPPPLLPVEKPKRKKKKPEPVEVTLVLDGTEHFSKLTAENLKLLDREFDVKERRRSSSLDTENDFICDTKAHSAKSIGAEIRRAQMEAHSDDPHEEMLTAKVVFHPKFNDSVVTITETQRKTPKYETADQKVRRMDRNRQKKICESGIRSLSKRETAINAIRHVKKVKFFQTHNRHLMPPLPNPSDFKIKSILKPPKPKNIWRYRIDWDGNKIYMRNFGPSEWQKKMDEKLNPKPVTAAKKKPKNILRQYTKMVAKMRNKLFENLVKEGKLEPKVLDNLKKKKNTRPPDVLVDIPTFGPYPPSRTLSSISASPNASLNSLLDALNAVDSTPASTNITPAVPAVPEVTPKPAKRKVKRVRSVSENNDPISTEPVVSKKYPIVYVGATVGRSPSTSTSAVNLTENEAYSSVAIDGSEILEYVGQEEPVAETVKRRFDPFVRPISALFKAFSSNPTEVGTEAVSRSRPTERTLRGLFRRTSPPMPEFSTRHVSASPTRRRVRLAVTSISQGSSAEDILALMQAQPNALELMEEIAVPKYPPLRLPRKLPLGTPMWRTEMKLKTSLYNQVKQLKEESMQRKISEYLDYYYKQKSQSEFAVFKDLVTFDLNRYMRANSYPRPTLDPMLIGKHDPNTLRIHSKTTSKAKRAVAAVLKKIKDCQERVEKAQKRAQLKASVKLSKRQLLRQAKIAMNQTARKKSRKIRVLYKFKRTCIKYRVQVNVRKSAARLLSPREKKVKDKTDEVSPTTPEPSVEEKVVNRLAEEVDVVSDIEEDIDMSKIADYDGDNDDDLAHDEDMEWVAASKPAVIRKNQRSKLLRKYFQFSVKMARKIARQSTGVQKPFIFYAFVSKIRSRIRQFMDIRRKDKRAEFAKIKRHITGTEDKSRKLEKDFKKSRRAAEKLLKKPFNARHALKFGDSAQKQVVVQETKFNFRKLNAKLETFFECLDEYIDVGTPIKLVFRSKNVSLPPRMFETGKKPRVDPVYYTSPTPSNTDSDFSDFSVENPKQRAKRRFFQRESLESTYHVKGLPGLLYLARLVQERVGDDVERNIPFRGPGMETCKLLVYMTPIRRLMLTSLGLRMPDRLNHLVLSRSQNEKFDLWFGRLFKMMCYGRGDICKYIIDKIALGQGPPNKKYETMDITYQAHIVHKLYKKMMYMENGKEAKMGVQQFLNIGLDIQVNPYIKLPKWEYYDHALYGDPVPWTRENWIEACDQFLCYSTTKESVLVIVQACLVLMRMIFTGGHSQDIIDELITMKIPIRDKLLFIINLTPPDHLVENIVKIFHTVRGLDRLPFVGLGYHADPLRVLFEEATESGDPQLIAHFVRIGRCLDRRSREPMMTDCGSEHIQNRDFGNIMCNIFNSGKDRRPFGAPTMDEMFPFRYVLHPDGTEVTETTEELAEIMECEVTRYMAILELTKGAAMTKGDLDHNPKFNTYPGRFFFDVLCTGCKVNVAKGRNLGRLGRTLCVSTMPLIEQDKDRKRWPNAKTMSPRLTFENYIETLDPTENKMLMAKDIEEEKTDITVQVLPSRFGCFQCRFSLPKCVVCMCPYLNDHMDFALKEYNERFSQFSVCNICNHGGHINHISEWFETEKFCPVAGCDCKCLRPKHTKNLKGKLRRHMLLSANMRAKSHLCNPECAMEADIDDGYLPDPDLTLQYE